MRISDADRSKAADHVRTAAGEGRLDINEVDVRLRAVYAATTYGELAAINADLPAPSDHSHLDQAGYPTPRSGSAIGIMGGFARRGAWRVPRRLRAIAFWGGGVLDLRQATFGPGVTTIKAYAVMGGVQILLPPDAEVHTTGVGIMGGFGHSDDPAPGAPGVAMQYPGRAAPPRVHIGGLAFWGGVDIRRPPAAPPQ